MAETEIEHHPTADLFPMRTEDELRGMAADIADRGLSDPIALHRDGRLLDGRNRLAACRMAEVEPVFVTVDTFRKDKDGADYDDAENWILSRNGQRRDLTKGQRAIIAAQTSKLDEHGAITKAAKAIGVNRQDVSRALTIVAHNPTAVTDVAAGGVPFDTAYKDASKAKRKAETEEEARQALPPDLAELVKTGHRTLIKATEEATQRETVAKTDVIRTGDGAPAPSFAERVEAETLTWLEAAKLAAEWLRERGESLTQDRDRVRRLNENWGVVASIRANPDGKYNQEMIGGLPAADQAALSALLESMED